MAIYREAASAASRLAALARSAASASLCVLLIHQPIFAEPPSEAPARVSAEAQLQGQQRVLHALNRLTFGPRPGEVAAVQAMGLQRWFELQLNPAKIDDSALDARLESFPAMNLSIQALNERYPGPAMIRAMEDGKVALPTDPTERTIAIDSIAFYKMQKARKEADKDDKADASQAALTADSGMPMANPQKPLAAEEVSPGLPQTAEPAPAAREAAMAVIAQPPAQRFQTILAMSPQDLVRFRYSLRGKDLLQLTAGLTPVQKETLAALPGGARMVVAETTESRLLRDIYSDRQLEAVMTDFWLNHFNVYERKSQVEPYLIPSYERQTILPNALGNFEDLLVATAKSPAMLVYLDNWQSTGPDSPQAGRIKRFQQARPDAKLARLASSGLNENYGRELMELHTLGVNGGYTQADVTQVAKVFTGWTIDKPYQQGGGDFRFDERRHEPGPKTVLGHTINESGEKEGLEVLHILATSPATAHFISSELAIRFVSDTPPPVLVDRMAQSFLASHGDIKTVLRTMFDSPEFFAPSVERAKVKTPLEFVVSAARASDVQVTNATTLVQSLDKLGMPLYGMQTPNGYSWTKDQWVSTGALVTRLNFALVMSADRLPGVDTEWAKLLGEPAASVVNTAYDPGRTSPEAVEEKRLESILLDAPVSERTRQTVLSQAADGSVAEQAAMQFDLSGTTGKKGTGQEKILGRKLNGQSAPNLQGLKDDPQAAAMAGLLLGSPEFQRR